MIANILDGFNKNIVIDEMSVNQIFLTKLNFVNFIQSTISSLK